MHRLCFEEPVTILEICMNSKNLENKMKIDETYGYLNAYRAFKFEVDRISPP